MNRPPRFRAAALSLFVAILVVGGCAGAPPTATSPLETQTPPPTVSPPPTGEPTEDASRPPEAILSINGAGEYAGELGTYIYRGAGSDSPWLPGRALTKIAAPRTARLEIRLEGGRQIGRWTARIAPPSDDGTNARVFVTSLEAGSPRDAISFLAPNGSFVLMVELDYADGSGSGAYYWWISTS